MWGFFDSIYERMKNTIRSIIRETYAQLMDEGNVYQWSDGSTSTIEDAVEDGKIIGKFRSLENAMDFNRTKYNRLTWQEQEIYVSKVNKPKTRFNAEQTDGSWVSIPEAVYHRLSVPEKADKNFFQKAG
jgi:hypothetical protein